MQKQDVITYKKLLVPCCCPHPSVALDGAISSCLPSVQAGLSVEEGYICFCICCALDLESFDK